jgi:Sulfotransferase domain
MESKKLKVATNNLLQVTYEDLWQNGEKTLMLIFSWLGVQISSKECKEFWDECQIANLRSNRLEEAPWDLGTEPQKFYRKGGTENWRSELTLREAFLIEHFTRDLMAEFGFVAASRRKIIFPLIVASRLRYAVAWRLRARKYKRQISERDL